MTNAQNNLFEIPGKTTVRQTTVVPDGAGVVRVYQPNRIEQSEFWLEVDCGTLHPTRLAWRLEKYYHASIGYAQRVGQMPRLLFVVDERAGDRRMWELGATKISSTTVRFALYSTNDLNSSTIETPSYVKCSSKTRASDSRP